MNTEGDVRKQYSIVAFGPNSWSGPWLNRQHILSRLGKSHNVFYTEGLLYTWHRRSALWAGAPWLSKLEKLDNVFVHQRAKLLLRPASLSFIDKLVLKLGMRTIRKAARKSNDVLIAYIFHPKFFPYIDTIDADLIVYHAYDLLKNYPDTNPEHLVLEKELLNRADIVIASSESIRDHLLTLSSRNIEVVENGGDFAAFSDTNNVFTPPDLEPIARPRLGYVGALNQKVDFPLAKRLAIANPKWNFVFVGEINTKDASILDEIANCSELPNIHFTGVKLHTELPAYCQNFDVNLMIYRTGAGLWSDAGSPLKLFEYLSTGRPVVGSKIQALNKYSEYIEIAETDNEWQACIQTGLSEADEAKVNRRIACARDNSWDVRINQIENLLDNRLSFVNSNRH